MEVTFGKDDKDIHVSYQIIRHLHTMVELLKATIWKYTF
jgi:hypothetical protein